MSTMKKSSARPATSKEVQLVVLKQSKSRSTSSFSPSSGTEGKRIIKSTLRNGAEIGDQLNVECFLNCCVWTSVWPPHKSAAEYDK